MLQSKIVPPYKTVGYTSRGADFGRVSRRPAARAVRVRLRLHQVRLDGGGYDAGGAYWGYSVNGPRLYCAYTTEYTLYVRATDRAEAKKIIRRDYPCVTFYR